MSNILAGIGRGQLEVLKERVAARRAIFERYRSALGEIDGLDFMPEAGYGRSTRWLTTLTVDPERYGVSRDQIIDALEAENIEARPVWKPMQLQPLYQGCKFYPHPQSRETQDRGTVPSSSLADLSSASVTPEPSPGLPSSQNRGTFLLSHGKSVSEQLFGHGLCLPSGSNLTEKEQERVIECIEKLL